jgi:2-polyprenyl-3-methyl-5-hydroxy-6-metoxy-1,4-benzoquinol methylase
MKQNIYDHPDFFAGYQKLRDNPWVLNRVLEQPALRSLLPPLAGKRVIDLGCGAGDFCREAVGQGAVGVTGVDLSERMLAEARAAGEHPAIRYVHAAVEDFRYEGEPVDLVISSLMLHYVKDYAQLVAQVRRWLAPGGLFVFSVEHPICTALLNGWCRDSDGRKVHWPVDGYKDEGVRERRWMVEGVIKYHRTVETYVNTLIDAGFVLWRLLEPEALPQYVAQQPDLAEERRRPPFLVIAAGR